MTDIVTFHGDDRPHSATRLADRLRAAWPIDDGHVAGIANHCRICGQRMPCDWSLAISDIHTAADRLEALERWKSEAIEALTGWEAVAQRVPYRPSHLGRSKSFAVADYIDRLEALTARRDPTCHHQRERERGDQDRMG